MIIRPAQTLDIPLLVNFWQAIDGITKDRPFGGDSAEKHVHAKKILQHTIDSENAAVLIASSTEYDIIGTISGHVFEKPGVNLAKVGVVYSLWVDEEHRCQGVGQQLLTYLENALITKGAQAFQVGWDTGNTTAEQWWQKRGYAPYETIASKVVSK
ncbi:MAG: ribosomal protein S18 acetylase RimI-like enzyme [Candidatus Endobugula sp.]|jgi:ribosomal protein S18 acetylase RimI-like enzyme